MTITKVYVITKPIIIPPEGHSICHSAIPKSALIVADQLHRAGYQAYLVGGCIRDMLLGLTPKDFDIATNAKPEQVKPLFDHCRLIGRRFRIAHVLFGREVIEVATFRAANASAISASGRILRDNVYGTLEEDTFRRDFTVNALYYDVHQRNIIDHTHAIEDICKRQLRLIGPVETRYREDPVRMLRAVRFSSKLGFTLAEDAARYIPLLAHHLGEVPNARLFEEVIKLLQSGHGVDNLGLLIEYGLFRYLFPQVHALFSVEGMEVHWLKFVQQALKNTDARIQNGQSTNPAFLYAVLLWPALREEVERDGGKPFSRGAPSAVHARSAAARVFEAQSVSTAIPGRFVKKIYNIWLMQRQLEKYSGLRAKRLLDHPCFRAAYDFLLLREQTGEATAGKGAWWTALQSKSDC